MAKNIVSTLESRENEIQGLLGWSFVPVRIIAVFSVLLGIQQVGTLLFNALTGNAAHLQVWMLVQGMSFFLVAHHCVGFSKFAQKYSDKEDDLILGKAMLCLGGFWFAYFMAIVFSSIPYLLQVFEVNTANLVLLWIAVPAVTLLIYWGVFRRASKLPFAVMPFTPNISSFAKLNVIWTRSIAFFAMGAGGILVFLYVTDRLAGSVLDGAGTLISGLCFVIVGVPLALLWRAVREIHRNPSLIYFERTMEKLNLFWLVLALSSGVLFVGRFF